VFNFSGGWGNYFNLKEQFFTLVARCQMTIFMCMVGVVIILTLKKQLVTSKTGWQMTIFRMPKIRSGWGSKFNLKEQLQVVTSGAVLQMTIFISNVSCFKLFTLTENLGFFSSFQI
jgi:hypothetical protein